MGVAGPAGTVEIDFLGRSCFSLHGEDLPTVLLEPLRHVPSLSRAPQPPDIVLITHEHIDHWPYPFGQKDLASGDPTLVFPFTKDGRVRDGKWRIGETFVAQFFEASHVTASGSGQGWVSMFAFDLGDVRFAHLGDLGSALTESQIKALGPVDVLFLPAGVRTRSAPRRRWPSLGSFQRCGSSFP